MPEARRLVPILSVLVAAVAVGVGVGVTALRHQDRVASAVITRPAPELGPRAHLLLPNLDDAVMVVPDRPHDPAEVRAEDRFERIRRVRRFTVSTNSRGMRGPDLVEPKRGPRVLCLGDSVTFGWGVPEAASYPARLRTRWGVEVVNAGVPAMKPDSIAAWARQHAGELEPDLVLFTRRPDHNGPDPYRGFQSAVRTVQQAVAPAPVLVILPPVSTFDVMGARVWATERDRVRQMLPDVPVLDLTEAFRAAAPTSGFVLEQAAGVQRVRRVADGGVELEAPAPPRGLAPEIVQRFEADPGFVEPWFFDGGHPTAEGFTIFVDAVAAFVEEQGHAPAR
jgi:lysophospholipase L1-like esterase